jgi:hypothetical protein
VWCPCRNRAGTGAGARVGALQAGDRKIGDDSGDFLRRLPAVRPEPLGGPVERAEKRSGRDGRIARAQGAAAEAGRHQAPNAPLVAVAFGDNDAAQRGRERIHLEMCRRSLDAGDQAEYVPGGQCTQALDDRPAVGRGRAQRREQAIERSVLTEEQELVLPAEIVIEVAGREIGGDSNIAHAGGGETAAAEDLCGGAENLDPPRLGPPF